VSVVPLLGIFVTIFITNLIRQSQTLGEFGPNPRRLPNDEREKAFYAKS